MKDKKSIFQKSMHVSVKSRFLRFGGSSWGLKIDFEKFEEEEKTTWKKTRTKEAAK